VAPLKILTLLAIHCRHGQPWTVVGHVAEVAPTLATEFLGPGPQEAVVQPRIDGVAVGRVVEARPARPGVELLAAAEQDLVTAGTPEHAVIVDLQQVRRPAWLCPRLSENPVLLVGQLVFGLRVAVARCPVGHVSLSGLAT